MPSSTARPAASASAVFGLMPRPSTTTSASIVPPSSVVSTTPSSVAVPEAMRVSATISTPASSNQPWNRCARSAGRTFSRSTESGVISVTWQSFCTRAAAISVPM